MASFYAMFGANSGNAITSDEKDCSVADGEDRKEEALGREGWASSDVRHLLVHLQQNALPLCDGSDGQGCSKAVNQ
jgi:hypothetical protein